MDRGRSVNCPLHAVQVENRLVAVVRVEPFTVTGSADEIFDVETGATFRAPQISANMVAVGTTFEPLSHVVWEIYKCRLYGMRVKNRSRVPTPPDPMPGYSSCRWQRSSVETKDN